MKAAYRVNQCYIYVHEEDLIVFCVWMAAVEMIKKGHAWVRFTKFQGFGEKCIYLFCCCYFFGN